MLWRKLKHEWHTVAEEACQNC